MEPKDEDIKKRDKELIAAEIFIKYVSKAIKESDEFINFVIPYTVNSFDQALFRIYRNVKRLLSKNKETVADSPEESTFDPQLDIMLFFAAFLFSRELRETALGDMTEQYNESVERFGKRRAKLLLVWDITLSVIPAVTTFFRKILIGLAKVAGLYNLIKIIFSKLSGF